MPEMTVSAMPAPNHSSPGRPETFTNGITATTGPASATDRRAVSPPPPDCASAPPPARSTPSTTAASTAPRVDDFVEGIVSLPDNAYDRSASWLITLSYRIERTIRPGPPPHPDPHGPRPGRAAIRPASPQNPSMAPPASPIIGGHAPMG